MMTNPAILPVPTDEDKYAAEIAPGFNPFNLTRGDVREDVGWYLLNEGDPIEDGDGYWHPEGDDGTSGNWFMAQCRPELLTCNGDIVNTWPHRRRTHPRKLKI